MAKYNLYRIKPEKRFELIEKLRADGLELAKKVEKDGATLEFLYSREPPAGDIWWTKTYRDFFESVEPPKNIVHSAAFFVYNDDFCYAAALGKTFSRIKDYSDPDFGVNMACRIAADRVKIKNSKFFKSRRNRVAASYQSGHRLEFDSGESLEMIRAATIDPAVWGQAANFGAAVQFFVDIAPDQMPIFVKKIEAVLKEPPRLNLPKVIATRNALEIKEFDGILAQTLLGPENENLHFIADDNCRYSFYLQGEFGNLSDKGGFNSKSLKKFFDLQNINLVEQINDLKVRIFDPRGDERSRNLKTMIDFKIDGDRAGLIDGKWCRYNQAFIDRLRHEADLIPIDTDKEKDVADNIDDFIAARAKNGFADCRKAIAAIDQKFKIDKLDLFKDGALYFLKFGNIEAINYAADQAINAIRFLQSSHGRLVVDGQNYDVDKICLWLVADGGKEIKKVSQIDSLNFLMKLADWKRAVLAAGFRPRIRVRQ